MIFEGMLNTYCNNLEDQYNRCYCCCPLALSSHPHVNYLLAGLNVRVDVLEHRLEHGIVAYAQVLDLYLAILWPVLRYLRGVCEEREAQERWFLSHFPAP